MVYRVWYKEVNGIFAGSKFIESESGDEKDFRKFLEKAFPGFKFKIQSAQISSRSNCFLLGGNLYE